MDTQVINLWHIWSSSLVDEKVEIVGTRGDLANTTVVRIPFVEFVAIYGKMRRQAERDKEAADKRFSWFLKAEGK